MSNRAMLGPKLIAAAVLVVATAAFLSSDPLRAMAGDSASVIPEVQMAQGAASSGQANAFIVYFPLDSDILSEGAEEVIDQAASVASERGSSSFTIYGHTDRNGPRRHNEWLSQRRANQVKDALVLRGFAADGINVIVQADSDLAVPTDAGVVEQANRRAVIVIE